MKKLSKLVLLKKADVLDNPTMKVIIGGAHCHCLSGSVYYIGSCSRQGCEDLCGGPGTAQNCNY
jgi:hypothetical protein